MTRKCSIVLLLLFIAASIINSNAERLTSLPPGPCRGVRALLYKCDQSKKGRQETTTETEENSYKRSPNLKPMSRADTQKIMAIVQKEASEDAEKYRREHESSPSPSSSPSVIPPSSSVLPPSPSFSVLPPSPSPSVASPPVIPPSPSVASPSQIPPAPSMESPIPVDPVEPPVSPPVIEPMDPLASPSVPEPMDPSESSPESTPAVEPEDPPAPTPVTKPAEPPASSPVEEPADPPVPIPTLEPVDPPASLALLESMPSPDPSTESTEAVESAEAISPVEEVPSPSATAIQPVESRSIKPTPSSSPPKKDKPAEHSKPSVSTPSDSTVQLSTDTGPQKNPESGHHMNHTVKVVCIVLASVCLAVVVIGNVFGLYYTYVHRSRDIDLALLE